LLIFVLGPISGAHFNPAVSLAGLIRKEMSVSKFVWYTFAQVTGAIAGAVLANLMFDSAAISISTHQRVTAGTLIGEVVATAGLIIVIYTFIAREKQTLIPIAVAAWIGSAYFFTSSTSFANPAVTLGRIFSDSFAGIAPESVLPFIAAQIVGMALGLVGVSALKR